MKNPSNSLPEEKMPALKPTESSLRTAVDKSARIPGSVAQPISAMTKSENLAVALHQDFVQNSPKADCHRKFWFTFFFDGTGNNLNADIGLSKHSNVARLFRAHKGTNVKEGVYKIYIPGIGTYFSDVGDNGGTSFGLGCGAMGEARINFALREFESNLVIPLSNSRDAKNSIKEINVAVFGFSRGAALARAFVNDFVRRNCLVKDGRWVLKQGGCPVRIRFMGLFDTVGSVGIPMSSNNMPASGMIDAYSENILKMLKNRKREYPNTRPVELAFSNGGRVGADPAPGKSAGHDSWGARLQINEMVEEVRHFVAAHEIRNSFPLDSISVLTPEGIVKPAHFHEAVYPGAHSDVGGGYAPGEGAKGVLPTEKLALIPLKHMYEHALRCGVPMLPILSWQQENYDDFTISPTLLKAYNHYVKAVGETAFLGEAFNKSMRLFLAWRFSAIRRRRADGRVEAEIIDKFDTLYKERGEVLNKEISSLEKKVEAANLNLEIQGELQRYRDNGDKVNYSGSDQLKDKGLQTAKANHKDAVDELLGAKARKHSLPNMEYLKRNLALYDNQLIEDVLSISEAIDPKSSNRNSPRRMRTNLRPHYKNLFEAFENEFLTNAGLKDELLILFFDRYVHDSLCGFGKDATLPSDPRVIFMGGDIKFRYAKFDDPSLDPLFGQETALA